MYVFTSIFKWIEFLKMWVFFVGWTKLLFTLHTVSVFICFKSGTKNKSKPTRKSQTSVLCTSVCAQRATHSTGVSVCFCVYINVCLSPAVHAHLCVCVSLQVFSNCSCVGVAGNFTAGAGPCPHTDDCDRMFPYFLALSVITSFIISLGGTPGYMILIRSDLKLL